MLEVLGADRSPIALVDGALCLEEAREYLLVPPPTEAATRPGEAYFGPVALDWSAARRAFSLSTSHAVGTQILRYLSPSGEQMLQVRVLPRPEKLSEDAWLTMLTDLDTWLPGLAVGEEAVLTGAVATGGAAAAQLVEAVLPLVKPLISAVRQVVANPRRWSRRVDGFAPAHTVRRIGRTTLAWLERHPDGLRALSIRWEEGRAPVRPPQVLTEETVELLDHPANRYLSWLVRGIANQLSTLAAALYPTETAHDPNGQGADEEGLRWRQARAQALRAASDELKQWVRLTWLSKVDPAPPSEAAMAVVIDEPTYARVHRLARFFRSPLFSGTTEPTALPAMSRPSYELYELWTFLAVMRELQRALPEHRWTSKGLLPLRSLGEPLDGAELIGEGPDSKVRLLFNPTFRGYLARGNARRFSISGERRPDLVLTWESPSRQGWLCLDAKYRVQSSYLADAFSSAHLYRDSLRWPSYGGRCHQAVLLVPAELGECSPWFSEAFLRDHQVGVFRATPGVESAARLGVWLREVLTGA